MRSITDSCYDTHYNIEDYLHKLTYASPAFFDALPGFRLGIGELCSELTDKVYLFIKKRN